MGDIHQPLHTVTRFTPSEPGGDRGGNFFDLGEAAPRKNLHSYWDAAGGGFGFRDIKRPLTQSGRTKLEKFANNIENGFPRSGMMIEVNKMDPFEWAKEGKALAISQVYQGIQEQDVPTQVYEKNAQKVSARRIALAGYRLAAILKQAL